MTAIVRVKRHIHEQPQDELMVSVKKRRLEEENLAAVVNAGTEGRILTAGEMARAEGSDETSTILKFPGKLQAEDKSLMRSTKDFARQMVTQKAARQPSNLVERGRQEMREISQESRFQAVNHLRTSAEANEGSNESANPTDRTFLDIVSHPEQQNESVANVDVDNLNQTDSDASQDNAYDAYYNQPVLTPTYEGDADNVLSLIFCMRKIYVTNSFI